MFSGRRGAPGVGRRRFHQVQALASTLTGGGRGTRGRLPLAPPTPFPTPATQLRAPCRQFASLQFWTMMAVSRSYLSLKLGSFLGALSRWKTASRRLPQEPALGVELFSADQMDLHGVRLAAQHRLSTD